MFNCCQSDNKKTEIEKVKALGEQIGYGNLMSWASALWRRCLKDSNLPTNGAFVPTIVAEISDSEQLYDRYVELFLGNSHSKTEI